MFYFIDIKLERNGLIFFAFSFKIEDPLFTGPAREIKMARQVHFKIKKINSIQTFGHSILLMWSYISVPFCFQFETGH